MVNLKIERMAIPPLPEPEWVGLFKWICGCVSGIFGFGLGVDQYFKYLKQQRLEANRLTRIEKEDFIKSVVNSAVTVAIADLRSDVQELKEDQRNVNQKILDIYRDRK